MNHTPETWSIRVAGTNSGRGPEIYRAGPYYDDGSEFVIADCGTLETSRNGKRWKRTAEADAIEGYARLLLAAPDLLRALKLIEWSGVHDGTLGSCASCGKHRTEGHREDCQIGMAIAKTEEK